ncbi:TPA: hypothetical protein ACH3X1_005862 [Trebouxia sp. C0004]
MKKHPACCTVKQHTVCAKSRSWQHVNKLINLCVQTATFPHSIATTSSDSCRLVCLHGQPELPSSSSSSEQIPALSVLQDWTKQENEDAEGVVSFSYRTKPEEPPDVQTIQKQMAIVAWQPGPNRIVQVPSQVEIDALKPGVVQNREPAKPQRQTYYARRFGQQAFGSGSRLIGSLQDMSKEEEKRLEEELKGTYETITLKANGQALVERRDVWGGSGSTKSLGLRFG